MNWLLIFRTCLNVCYYMMVVLCLFIAILGIMPVSLQILGWLAILTLSIGVDVALHKQRKDKDNDISSRTEKE